MGTYSFIFFLLASQIIHILDWAHDKSLDHTRQTIPLILI